MRQQLNTGIESFVLLALVAALPVAFASGFTMYEVLKEGILLVGAAVLTIAWAVGAWRAGTVTVRGGLGLVALLGLGTFALVSALWAPNGLEAVWSGARWFALAAIALAILAPTGRPVSLPQLVLAVAVGSGIAGALGVLDVFGVPLDASAPGAASDGFRGPFDNDRIAALSLSVSVPFLAASVFALRSRVRWVAAAALVPVALFVGATAQWDAFFVALGGVTLAAALWAVRRGVSSLRSVALPAIAVVVVGIVGVGGHFLAQAAVQPTLVQVGGKVVESKDPSRTQRAPATPLEIDLGRPDPPRESAERYHARSTAWQMVTRHPVGGVGAGNFEIAQVGDLDVSSTWYQGLAASYPGFRYIDSSGLQLATELGFIGLLLLLLFVGVALRAGFAAPEDESTPADFGLLGGLGACLVAIGIGGALESAVGAVMFVVFAAWLLQRGAGAGWTLGGSPAGVRSLERYGLGLALPLGLAALMLYAGTASTASDYCKARGDVWVQAGALERAQTSYLDAVAWWAGNDEAALNYAIVTTTRSKGFSEEERSVLAALALRPFDPRLYKALGQVQIREAVDRKRKTAPPSPEPGEQPDPEQMLQALDIVDRTVLAKAQANFTRATELHPRYIDARESFAHAFLLTGESAKQQTELLKLIDTIGDTDRKRTARVHASLAQSYLGAEDWARARKHIERALALDPEHPRRKSMAEDLALIQAREKGIQPKKGPDDGHGH